MTKAYRTALLGILLISAITPPSDGHQHNGRVVLMGKSILAFDDMKVLFHAGMTANDFFDRLECRTTEKGARYFLGSKPISTYPESVTVKVFASPWKFDEATPDKRYSGKALTFVEQLQFKAEWKTGLNLRPVSSLSTKRIEKSTGDPNLLLGYELSVNSQAVPLTDHLVVSVYDAESNLIVRFSGAP